MAQTSALIDTLQERLYNWLNGPTTLNDQEINQLVNNITFLIRRMRLSTSMPPPHHKHAVPDSEIYIALASTNTGFQMCVFVGEKVFCPGVVKASRQLAMEGLRERAEEWVGKTMKGGVGKKVVSAEKEGKKEDAGAGAAAADEGEEEAVAELDGLAL